MKTLKLLFFSTQFLLCVNISAQVKPNTHFLIQSGYTSYTSERYENGIEFGVGFGLDWETYGKINEYLPAERTAKITLGYLSAKETGHDSISLKRLELEVYINRNYRLSDNVYFYLTGGLGLSYYYFKNEQSEELKTEKYDSKMGLPFGLGLGFDIYVGPLSFYVEDKFKIDLVSNNYFTWEGSEFRLTNYLGGGIRVRIN